MSLDKVTIPEAGFPAACYEITLTVAGVKEEHAAYVASQLFLLQRLFKLDGTNVETAVSAERNRDGVERIYDLVAN